ncbi:zinc finger protein 770 [Trichomycterus rosablanca]|uniref:zinc finger protein 770 n=1 Tax=Trichomycterus rosablanca TaxID=2290929 RepID=UPI002F356E40
MIHRCSVCLKQFDFFSKLQRHLLTHSGERPFSCAVCKKAFRQASHLKAHLRCHSRPNGTSERALGADESEVSCTNLEEGYVLNVRSEILKDAKSESQPDHQNCKFWDLDDVKNAELVPYSEDATITQNKVDGSDQTQEQLRFRYRKEDRRIMDDTHTLKKKTANLPSRYQCAVCLKCFSAPSKLKRHVLIHSSLRPFGCKFCTKAFRQLAHLKVHMVTHLSQRHIRARRNIPKSGKRHPQGTTEALKCLYEPQKRNPTEEPVPVKEPNESTFNMESFPKNMTSLNYKCPTCLKCFSAPSKLRRHCLIHTGQRPFQCSICGRAFRQPSHLKSHYSVHTGAKKKNSFLHLPGANRTSKARLKRLVNNSLAQKFHRSVKQNLQKLKMTRSSPGTRVTVDSRASEVALRTRLNRNSNRIQGYVCTVCLKGFNAPSKLMRHALIHTGQRPFRCPVCCRGFNQKANLKAHTCRGKSKATPSKVQILETLIDLDQTGTGTIASISAGATDSKDDFLSDSNVVESNANDVSSLKTILPDDTDLAAPSTNPPFEASGPLILPEETKESSYQCTICSKTFNFPSKLSRHLLIHTNIKPFKCTVCGKSFRQLCHLQCHSKVHTRNKTPCASKGSRSTDTSVPKMSETNTCRPVLGSNEDRTQNLVKREDVEHQISRFPVQIQTEDQTQAVSPPKQMTSSSNSSFSQTLNSEVTSSSVLKLNQEHATPNSDKMVRKHDSSQFHSFTVEKSVSFIPDLEVTNPPAEVQESNQAQTAKTISNPTKIGANQCTFCLKTFDFPSKLTRHLLVHTGIRPYRCQICHKSFKQLSHLQCHRWVHSRRGSTLKLEHTEISSSSQNSSGSTTAFNELDLPQEDHIMYSGHHHHQAWISNGNSDDNSFSSAHVACRIKSETDPPQDESGYSVLQHKEDPPATDGTSRILFSSGQDRQNEVWSSNHGQPAQTFSSKHSYMDWSSRSDTEEQSSAEMSIWNEMPQPESVQSSNHGTHSYMDCSGKYFEQVDQSCVDGNSGNPVCGLEQEFMFKESLHSVPESSSTFCDNFRLGFDSYQHDPSRFNSSKTEEDPVAPHHLPNLTKPLNDLPICSSCSQCFNTVEELQVHQCPVLCPEEKARRSYQCAVCFKSFEAPSKLKRHYLIHTGQRPFHCTQCDKAFTQSSHLKTHMLSHR